MAAEYVGSHRGGVADANTGRASTSFVARLSFTIAGNAGMALYQSAMLLIAARLASVDDVGVLAVGLAVSAPLLVAGTSGLRLVQIRDVDAEAEPGAYLVARLWCVGAAAVASVALLQLFAHGTHEELLMCAVVGLRSSEAIADSSWSSMLAAGANALLSRLLLVRSVLSTLAFLIAEAATRNTPLALTMVTACSVALFVLVERSSQRALWRRQAGVETSRPSGRAFRSLLKAAIPLGLASALTAVAFNLPRYFLAQQHTPREVAIFSVLASVFVVVSLFTAALGQTAVPNLARYVSVGDRQLFRSLLGRMLASGSIVGGLAALIGVAVGAPLIRAVYGPAFQVSREALAFVFVALFLSCQVTFLQDGLTASRKAGAQVIGFGLGALATVIVCAVAVRPYGVEGAAAALIAGPVVQAVVFGAVLTGVLRRWPAEEPLSSAARSAPGL